MNLEQARRDIFAECYSWDCDSKANLPYSLGRHIYEIFNQLVIGAPAIGLEGCFDDSYPTLMLEHKVSEFIYDALIPARFVEYCLPGKNIEDALKITQNYIGMNDCFDLSVDYSTESPTLGPTAGNNVLADGDSLTAGMKDLDMHMLFYRKINGIADGGLISAASDPSVEAHSTAMTLDLLAGPGIEFELTEVTSGNDSIKISTIQQGAACCPLQDSYIAGAATSAGIIHLDSTYPEGGTLTIRDNTSVILTKDLFEVLTYVPSVAGGPSAVKKPVWQSGQHPLYSSGLGSFAGHLQSTGVAGGPSNFNYYRNDGWNHPLYLKPLLSDNVPDTSGATHPNAADPGFNYLEPEGAIFVGNGVHGLPDRDGNPIGFGGLYYREPNSGDIWNLLCCGVGGGASNNLGQTYNIDTSGNTFADGGKIVLDANADYSAGIHLYDDSPSVIFTDTWLTGLYNSPLLAVGKSSQNADADAHFSISRAAQGAEEVTVNNHFSPVNFSIRAGDPLTPAHQGSLYCKVDAASTHPHIHWRDPNNGAVYDLTNAGASGNAYRHIKVAAAGAAPGSSFTGDSNLFPTDMNSVLAVTAGNYIGIHGGEFGTGLDDVISLSVNPMPADFLSDVGSATVVDGSFLAWDAAGAMYEPSILSNIGAGTGEIFDSYASVVHEFGIRTLSSIGSHVSALSIATNVGTGTVDFELLPDQIALGDIGNVDSTVPADGDALSYDSATSTWGPAAIVHPTQFANVEQWIPAGEWDMRANSALGVLNGPNTIGNDGEHFQNKIHRGAVWVSPPAGTNQEWAAFNAVPFTFNNAMQWDDQLTYATVAVPRVDDGVGGWIYPQNIKATAFFVSASSMNYQGGGHSVSYTLTVSDDGNAGQLEAWSDGMNLKSFNFANSPTPLNGHSIKTSSPIIDDLQVSVIEFDPMTFNRSVNGLLTLRISPRVGTGAFAADNVPHYFVGLRLDFTS